MIENPADITAGVIVAGGAGTRLGGRKSLLTFGPGTLLDAVIARVRPQVALLALNVPAEDADIYRTHFGGDIPLLHDRTSPPIGPLGGVLAGLEWARTTGSVRWLASFPGDTPFLPENLVVQLRSDAGANMPVAASDAVRIHALCAVWPLACAEALRSGIESGCMRSMMSAIEQLNGRVLRVVCTPDAFLNINTPADLARAEAISERRHTR